MKKIFLDANVVIDYLDSSSKDHFVAKDCLQIIRKHFGKPVVSPITFVITDFILGKFIKNKEWHKKQMQLVFSAFEMTDLKAGYMDAVFKTHFVDLEDGLQHRCALQAKAFVIITKNLKDYFDSEIPAVHPDDFVLRYKNIISFPGRK
ncbi:MAG: PIN domain-containing protein [Bacteroidetes bacterium]|nr:PIN domain-containing protein [Bacteroidota bacterium]